jgi:hypothetical protein
MMLAIALMLALCHGLPLRASEHGVEIWYPMTDGSYHYYVFKEPWATASEVTFSGERPRTWATALPLR